MWDGEVGFGMWVFGIVLEGKKGVLGGRVGVF